MRSLLSARSSREQGGARSTPRARSASPRNRALASAMKAVVTGVGGGIVGSAAPGYDGVVDSMPRSTRSRSASASRSRSPRGRRGDRIFSRPPVGSLSLSGTPASERPVGLLGAVLRREAAISAMKTAVQMEPPPERTRERRKLLGELADAIHEYRESTADAAELLASRPEGSARFYWNGMDLVLKMLTDLQWAPFPQTLDPLLWRWFGYWSDLWAKKQEATDPVPFDVRGGPDFMQRCRLAEKVLYSMARDASTEGAGMGGWASQKSSESAETLLLVQTHRLTAPHSEGGANFAQKRRFTNMELLLYGRSGVHLEQLKGLGHATSEVECRAATFVQYMWRLRKSIRDLAARAGVELRGDKPAFRRMESFSVAVSSFSAMSPSGRFSPVKEGGSSPGNSPIKERSPVAPSPPKPSAAESDKLDRSFLAQMSVGLPDLS